MHKSRCASLCSAQIDRNAINLIVKYVGTVNAAPCAVAAGGIQGDCLHDYV